VVEAFGPVAVGGKMFAGCLARPSANVHVPMASALGVELAASFDPVTPWVDLITAAVSNVSAIGAEMLMVTPGALTQQTQRLAAAGAPGCQQ
jgi:hypothetical protein